MFSHNRADGLDDVLGQVRLIDTLVGDEAGLGTQVRDAELVVLARVTALKAHALGSECEEVVSVAPVGGHNLCGVKRKWSAVWERTR